MSKVEEVARAIHETAWPFTVWREDAANEASALKLARAAIAAMREPSEAMVFALDAGARLPMTVSHSALRDGWANAIDAALQE